MKSWYERPQEIAYLLNPAFCGEVIRRSITKYYDNTDLPFQYPLLYLILPIVLHRATRNKLPSSSRKQMHAWLQENQSVRIGFASRAKEMIPITKESVIFLMQLNALEINNNGTVQVLKYKKVKLDGHTDGEIAEIMKRAEAVGKWFSSAGTVSTIYTMWGVKP
ncbi:MAG: hypothetical protein K0R31_2498 [Clostridiales bacterium]|nr:hypothetical protein [Clostridiales bacterium]